MANNKKSNKTPAAAETTETSKAVASTDPALATSTETGDTLKMVALTLIDKESDRDHGKNLSADSADSFAALVASIKANGNTLDTPVVLHAKPDGRYKMLAGRRRVEAFEVLGLAEIPANVKAVSWAGNAAGASLRENVTRKDLSPGEKIRQVQRVLAEAGKPEGGRGTAGLVAKEVGCSESGARALTRAALKICADNTALPATWDRFVSVAALWEKVPATPEDIKKQAEQLMLDAKPTDAGSGGGADDSTDDAAAADKAKAEAEELEARLAAATDAALARLDAQGCGKVAETFRKALAKHSKGEALASLRDTVGMMADALCDGPSVVVVKVETPAADTAAAN